MALMFFQLRFEAFEQGKRIGGRAGKTGENLVVIKPSYFARRGLDDHVAERDLTVAAHGDFIAAPHGDDGGAVKTFHEVKCPVAGNRVIERV